MSGPVEGQNAAWVQQATAHLWDRYGVHPIGLEAEMETEAAKGSKVETWVGRVGKRFNLEEVNSWKDRPNRKARRAKG